MKRKVLLVSDFDNTYYFGANPIDKLKIRFLNASVKNFEERGNVFSIITGRDTASVIDKTTQYGIPYDYLLPYKGRVILDKNNRLVSANFIDGVTLKRLIEAFNNSYLFGNIHLYNAYGITNNPNDIVRISIEYKDLRALSLINDIIANSNIVVKYMPKRNKATISVGFTKKDGIEELRDKELPYLEAKNVYTIGDSKDDICMLLHENGYRTKDADHAVKKLVPRVSSVSKLVKHIGK